ncbi:MAG: AAA family ATPase [Luteitalea sp.]|nr:AAA family ATPase [Luteitalea sp.]
MGIEEQGSVIAFLSAPATYGPAAGEVERIDTHISIVWLAGDRAYKLKRAVRYDYVDFSSVERRRLACEAEVALNRRTAPSLYRGVLPVTRERDGSLALAGDGVPIDWLVEMQRFDQNTLFDRLADRHQLDMALMGGLADGVARLHSDAERCLDRGGREGMAWVVDGNALGFSDQGAGVLDATICRRLTADTRHVLDRDARQLDARRRAGFVRRCHGDLHLRNICLIDGVPTLFDGVEFNDDVACIDVLYDLAFLLMDLWRRDLRQHANMVFNEYLARSGEIDGLGLLPLFLSCRAAVRAKTSVSAAKVQSDDRQRLGLEGASREYLALAERFLSPPLPCLIAVGGFSGSGKSTLARGLGPDIGAAPGAVILRSDTIRKSLLGVAPLERLGADGYSPALTRRVYDTIRTRARTALTAGQAAIADAVYARPEDRAAIAEVARAAGVPFAGLWLEGTPAVLAERLATRVHDASDATIDVLEMQLESDCGEVEWHRLDASVASEQVRYSAEQALGALIQLRRR